MTISKTTTDLSTLKINYLTQEMYEDALENNEINENELYVTPGGEGGGTIDSTDVPTVGKIAEFDSTAHMNSEDMSSTEINNFVGNLGYTFNLVNMFYPVGSYYETSDTTFNPNTAWGGTWVLETEGQVHVSGSADGTYQVSGASTDTSDGGAPTVTLQTTQIPSHIHPIQGGLFYYTWGNSKIINSSIASMTTSTSGAHFYNAETSTSGAGGGQAHENMPPYIVVNRWHRTA